MNDKEEKDNIDLMIVRYNEDSITLRELVDGLEEADRRGIVDRYEDIDTEDD